MTNDFLSVWIGALALLILIVQIPATAIVLSRLFKALNRRFLLQAHPPTPDLLGTVSIVVPTLNEAERISPCLSGLSRQSYEVREILIVDSCSTDGTREMVQAKAQRDPRFRLITDDPLPSGWVGRPWALHTGFLHSSPKSEWVLGIDADTQPSPALAATLLQTAIAQGYDLISLSCRFILKYPGELWLQPALLMTLIYRFGPPDTNPNSPERVMANGQCFLCRREVLEAMNGYTSASRSFCDDVTLARNVAAKGFKVGFLDGANLLKVRMYDGFWDTWSGWGRSLDLKDASSVGQLWGDLGLLLAVQGLPLPILLLSLGCWGFLPLSNPLIGVLLGLNLFWITVRFALCGAIASAYDLSVAQGKWIFWLSPFADPLAVVRLFVSANRKPTQWRGRIYSDQ
ncbi:2'-O-glycosyltransferase CruG [Limnoraphis robusta]|uniref:Glycosyl transferase n=1 Tax=Limnoraphis robusta CS-951 TaxID=1637645 RepID=A0A0F5YI24_9CYAN|nr:glycosyltransferase family 2 protein [Limnoraphis robusta]KKD38534.1 glycosyl transferase [Limnoraphis robusta CS-951]